MVFVLEKPERRRGFGENLARGAVTAGAQAPSLLDKYSSLLESQEKQKSIATKNRILNRFFPGEDKTSNLSGFADRVKNPSMGGQPAPTQEAMGQRAPSPLDLSYDDIAGLTLLDPELGKGILGVKESARAEKKLSDEYVQGIVEGYEGAQISQANLEKMAQLEKSGKLVGPYKALLSNTLGIPMSILGNPESEEFEKLVSQRGLGVAKAYGFGRILQTEYENFLRTIPTLMNSPEGRARIRDTLSYVDKLAIARYQTMNEILRENGGRRPVDINERVTARMAPEYNKAKEFLLYGDELVDVVSPKGKKGKIPKKELEEAMKEGYTIPGMQ